MVPFSEKRASPKPIRDSHRRKRLDANATVRTTRKVRKVDAKKRDGYRCRYPHKCLPLDPLESAHIIALSLGGSDELSNLLTTCRSIHRGTPSMHGGDVKAIPTTKHGANGPVDFYVNGCYVGTTEPGARK